MSNLTIIIPIFNGSAHLKNLLYLLDFVDENLTSVMVIDDGSTDGTFDKLQEIKLNYPNLILLRNKINKGLGPTRNKGIDQTQTPYLCFLDIDDRFLLKFNDSILKKIELNNSDFCIFSYVFKSRKKEAKIDYETLININLKNYPKLANVFPSWSAIYSTKFIRNNQIRFMARIYEDYDFTLHAVLKAKRISIFNESIVEYNKENNQSITSFKDNTDLHFFLKQILRVNTLLENHTNVVSRSLIVNRLAYYFSFLINKFGHKTFFDNKNIALLGKVKSVYKKFNITIKDIGDSEEEGILYDKGQNFLAYRYFLFINNDVHCFIKMLSSSNSLSIENYYEIKSKEPFLYSYLNERIKQGLINIQQNKQSVINFNNIKSVSIHVGYTKTGTTLIQQNLIKSYNDLLKKGVLYPKSLLSQKTAEYNDVYNSDHNEFSFSFTNLTDQSLMIRNFQDELNKNKTADHLIISSENIIELDDYAFEKLIDFFSGLKIYIHLSSRDLLDWVDSSYKEKIKSSRYFQTMSLYLNECIGKNLLPIKNKISYLNRLSTKRGFIFKVHNCDFSDDYFTNIYNSLTLKKGGSIDLTLNKRASNYYSILDYINMFQFNYYFRNIDYSKFINLKREYLKSLSFKTNGTNKINYTFIDKRIPYKAFEAIGIEAKTYIDDYFIGKEYYELKHFNFDEFSMDLIPQEKNPIRNNYSLVKFIKKFSVFMIHKLLENAYLRRLIFKLYPHVSSLSLTQKIIRIYKNNL